MADITVLKALLDPLDETTLECDGLTRIASVWLTKAGIEHTIFLGHIRLDPYHFCPHFWIEVDEYRIDYRARLWLGNNEQIAHGVFLPQDSAVLYSGEAVNLKPISDGVIDFLLKVNKHSA